MNKLLLCMVALAAVSMPVESIGRQPIPSVRWDFPSKKKEAVKISPNKVTEVNDTYLWGYCEEPAWNWAGGLPAGLMGYSLVGFTENLTEKFDGCIVESILIAKGYFVSETPKIDVIFATGTVDNSQGYPSLKIEDAFIEMKDVDFSGDNYSWVEIPLEEPWEIEAGVPFFAGWGYLQESDADLPLVGDMIANGNPDSSWMGGDYAGTPITSYPFWDNCNSAGANCIRLRISGENLPINDITIERIDCPRFIVTGQDADITLSVKNAASNVINDIDILCVIPGGPQISIPVSGLALATGEDTDIKLDGINFPFEGNIPLEIEVQSVNGSSDSDPSNNFVTANVLSLAEGNGYERNVVVEEGTGTWCGNCPRGIVGMHKMSEKYGEKFIGIAAHSNDRMQIAGYEPFLNRYIDIVGYPYCTVDRVYSCDPNFNELESNCLKEFEVPAIAEVNIVNAIIDGSNVNVCANAKFCADEYFGEYAWAYVITEDNVGPYDQTNYFTPPGSLVGWDYTEPTVSIYFDEVARSAFEILGAEGSFPQGVKADEVYDNSVVLDASKVDNWDNAHLIAMVVNRKTGYVENSAHYSFDSNNMNIVEANTSHIITNGGDITLVSGENVDVFSLSGIKIASLRAGESVKTGPGVFLVKGKDGIRKLIVR